MKKYKVTPTATIPDTTGDSYPELHETDIAEIGQNAMEGDNAIVDDFIIKPGGHVAILGGDYQFAGGLQLTVYKPLRAWRGTDGKEFADQDSSPQTVAFGAADNTNARIDLVYALMEEDADGGQQTRHYFKDPNDPNAPQGDVSVYTEKQNKLTILVATGTPAASPAVPPTPSNGAAMYEVTIPAGATVLTDNNVRDVRHNFRTLEECSEAIDELENEVNVLQKGDRRVPADHVDIGPGAGKFSGKTDQEAWNILGNQSDNQTNDPLVRPELLTPDVAPTSQASGKLGSTSVLDGSTQAVDVPVGRQVSFFGSGLVTVQPSAFPATVEGVSINPRTVNKNVNAAVNSRSNTVALSLADISAVQSDGGGAFALLGYQMPSVRAKSYSGQRLACAWNATKIVVAGGANSGFGDAAVFEIDTVAGTVTQKTLTGTPPAGFILGVFPFGDNQHVLIAQQPGDFDGKLEWFKVDMTAAPNPTATKYTDTAPGYSASAVGQANARPGVIGDLIAPNLIMLMVWTPSDVNGGNATSNKVWFFHIDSDSFESFTPVGQNPVEGLNGLGNVDVALYSSGKAVLLRGLAGISTHLFDAATRTWSKQNLTNPTPDISSIYGATLWGLTLANVNGRVLATSETSSVFELTPGSPPKWDNRGIVSGLGSATSGRGGCGLVGLISGALPTGAGYLIAGRVNNVARQDIWGWAPGGIVQAGCGLTLGGSTTQASFVIDDGYQLPWVVGATVLNPVGFLPQGSIKLELDVDGNWVEIIRDQINIITSSDSNPRRKIRVTLFGAGSTRPCIGSINELYEQESGPGLVETVIRFNIVTAGVRYLYINRDGTLAIENTFQATTPDKAVLMEITPGSGVAPTIVEYFNKRWSHRKYTATRAGGATPSIPKEWPVLPSFIRASLVASGGGLSNLADPAFVINSSIAVAGLTSDGQSYIVEFSG